MVTKEPKRVWTVVALARGCGQRGCCGLRLARRLDGCLIVARVQRLARLLGLQVVVVVVVMVGGRIRGALVVGGVCCGCCCSR